MDKKPPSLFGCLFLLCLAFAEIAAAKTDVVRESPRQQCFLITPTPRDFVFLTRLWPRMLPRMRLVVNAPAPCNCRVRVAFFL